MSEPRDLVLDQLKAIRGELKFLREAALVFSGQQAQMIKQLGSVQSDIALLENKNLDRHSEILELMCRIEDK